MKNSTVSPCARALMLACAIAGWLNVPAVLASQPQSLPAALAQEGAAQPDTEKQVKSPATPESTPPVQRKHTDSSAKESAPANAPPNSGKQPDTVTKESTPASAPPDSGDHGNAKAPTNAESTPAAQQNKTDTNAAAPAQPAQPTKQRVSPKATAPSSARNPEFHQEQLRTVMPQPASTPPGNVVKQPAPPEGTVAPAVQKLQTSRPQLALTLAGGGAHVGVLKVLEAYGIKPDLVTGASMGAVVGSLYCAGVPTAQIERMFLDGTVKKAFLPTPIPIQALKWIPAYSLQRLFGKKPQIGLYSGDRIARMMKRALPPDRQLIERFPRPFSAISVNVLDSRPVCTSKGSAPDAVRAGATVPFIYRPVLQDGKELVDGGVRANLPTHPAAASGAPVIVAVRMYGSLKSETREKYETLKTYTDRILSLLLAQIESDATANADIVIEPEIPEMHLYDFDPEIEKRAIYAGEQAALKAMPKILAKLRQTEGTAAAKQGPTAGGAM